MISIINLLIILELLHYSSTLDFYFSIRNPQNAFEVFSQRINFYGKLEEKLIKTAQPQPNYHISNAPIIIKAKLPENYIGIKINFITGNEVIFFY